MIGRALHATLAGAGLCAVLSAPSAFAQTVEYPVNPVALVTLSSPGGGTDVFLREVIKHLGPIMGVDFVIENVAGGAGAAAMAHTATAANDGSVLFGTTPTIVNTSLLSDPDYGYEDLSMVANFFFDPSILYVRADSEFQTLQDVLDYAAENPGELKFGLSTPTSQDRYVVEKLKALENIEITAVSFDGGGDLQLAMLNGTVEVSNGEPTEMLPRIESGEVRPLVVWTDERLGVLPDVPTAKELGLDISMFKFRGLAGPKDLPEDVLAAWDEAAALLMEDPEFKAWYEPAGLIPALMPAAEAQAFMDEFLVEQGNFFRSIEVIP